MNDDEKGLAAEEVVVAPNIPPKRCESKLHERNQNAHRFFSMLLRYGTETRKDLDALKRAYLRLEKATLNILELELKLSIRVEEEKKS
jgi:hypothetical protein